jgi:hypothetical protein
MEHARKATVYPFYSDALKHLLIDKESSKNYTKENGTCDIS